MGRATTSLCTPILARRAAWLARNPRLYCADHAGTRNLEVKVPAFFADSDGGFGVQSVGSIDVPPDRRHQPGHAFRQNDCLRRVGGKWYSFFELGPSRWISRPGRSSCQIRGVVGRQFMRPATIDRLATLTLFVVPLAFGLFSLSLGQDASWDLRITIGTILMPFCTTVSARIGCRVQPDVPQSASRPAALPDRSCRGGAGRGCFSAACTA